MTTLRERIGTIGAKLPGTRRTTVLFVDGGIVPCPRQGDISLEYCLSCALLERVEGEPITRIECRVHEMTTAGGFEHLAV